MINKISDNKKFWLVTIIYLGVFWILPLQPFLIDRIFGFYNYLLQIIHVNIEAIILYFLIIIPVIIILCYLYIRKLRVKYKTIIFIFMFVIITYIPMLLIFLNGLSKIRIQLW